MKVSIDLHIHSALSPCGDNDMTPNNIVNLCSLLGIDVIALCDHNSIGNVDSAILASKDVTVTVIPGMELETSEDVHFVCLFETQEAAKEFDRWLTPFKSTVKNRSEIFGEQRYLNENDELTGTEENLLVTACSVSIYEVKEKIDSLPAVIIPAHVDRDSYSIISNLGFIPEDLQFTAVEISKNVTKEEIIEKYPYLARYNIICGSDAHYLENFSEEPCVIEAEAPTAKAVIAALKNMPQHIAK